MKLTVAFWTKALLLIVFLFVFLPWLSYLFGCLNERNYNIRGMTERQESKRLIFVITPTYTRPEQNAELTRLGQTLWLDGEIFWIVIEDANETSSQVGRLLSRFSEHLAGVTHLAVATPSQEKLSTNEPRWKKVRGVHQRNAGIAWLRVYLKSHYFSTEPVVYFADDDNTYDVRLFDKMRYIERVGVWPVGLVGKILYEGPICNFEKSKVLYWRTNYRADRFCACDMAGFGLSASLITKHENVFFSTHPGIGMLEADFLARLVFYPANQPPQKDSLSSLEPIVCDEILVWHTRTLSSDLTAEEKVNAKIPAVLSV